MNYATLDEKKKQLKERWGELRNCFRGEVGGLAKNRVGRRRRGREGENTPFPRPLSQLPYSPPAALPIWRRLSALIKKTHPFTLILGFHSRDQQPCFSTETKEDVSIIIAFNSRRIGSGHQHGRHFIVWGYQHGGPDVM